MTIELAPAVMNGLKISTSRGEGGNCLRRAVPLISSGAVNAPKIMTHHFPIEEFHKGYDYFVNFIDGAIKVVITMD